MFKVENNVPDVYVQESRDFQLFSRLYDLVFQCSRFSIDSMRYASDSRRCHDSLLPLISTKVGFFTNTRLTDIAHRKILAAFPYIVRYKGSLKGLQLIANLLGTILNTSVTLKQDDVDKNLIIFSFDTYAPDFALLDDMLSYMRPTGFLIDYEITSSTTSQHDYAVSDFVKVTDMSDIEQIYNNETDVTYTVDIEHNDNVYTSTVGFTQIYDNVKELTQEQEGEQVIE